MNIADCITHYAALSPDAPAIETESKTISYSQLEAMVWQISHGLKYCGLGAGDTVGICMRSQISHVAASLALARLGVAQFGLVSGKTTDRELDVARIAGVSAIVTDIADRRFRSFDVIAIEENWLEAIGNTNAGATPISDPDLTCLIGTSSGSTGSPKVMRLTHRMMGARAGHAGAIGFGEGDRFLSLLDVSIFMQKSLCWRVLMGGATIIFPNTAEPEKLAIFCEQRRVTNIYAFPFMVSSILPMQNVRHRYRDIKVFAMAGATVTEQMCADIIERITDNVFISYGSGEVGNVSYADLSMRGRYSNAVGEPMNGVNWGIVDDDGRKIPVGNIGHFRVRTPGMIDGYVGDQELTRNHFRDGWFYPNDLMSVSEDGILRFHGRADDMMIIDGNNIYPREIEETIGQHPAVAEAAAFPMASASHQDVPAVAVILADKVNQRELKTFCRNRLGPRAPQFYFFVKDFPRSATGKVLREELAENFVRSKKPRR